MRLRREESANIAVCCPVTKGRILNYDQKGRSFKLLLFRQLGGVRQLTVLSELKVGESGVLLALDLPESVQNHLMHMGFVHDALVTAVRRAPAGDPTVYCVDGLEIALRHETAEAIRMRAAETEGVVSHETLAGPNIQGKFEVPELTEAAR
jgi:Fe2+ transport system protein FeoA